VIPKARANEAHDAGSSGARLQSSLPPVRDRRRNAVAPARTYPHFRRGSSEPRRLRHSERLDKPARKAVGSRGGRRGNPSGSRSPPEIQPFLSGSREWWLGNLALA
jgi:hypothetical protein